MLRTLAHLFTPKESNNHRPRIIHPEGFVVLTALMLIFHITLRFTMTSTPLGNVLGYASSITANQVLTQTNERRTQIGLQPLKENSKLTAAAVAKATDMFAQQYWSHNSPTGTQPWAFIKNAGYRYAVAGENLARDFGDTESMVQAWIDSPTHKANILHKRYTETGIAVVDGVLQGVETTLVVQMFGSPSVSRAKLPEETTKPVASATPQAVAQVHTTPTSEPSQEKSEPLTTQSVLSEITPTPMFSPLQLSKSFFLATLFVLLGVLAYDLLIAHHKQTVRIVGKNLAHIALLIAVVIIVIWYKGGSLL